MFAVKLELQKEYFILFEIHKIDSTNFLGHNSIK